MTTSSKSQTVEISAPADRDLGAAVWGLLDLGYIVTITPSKKGARVGGYTITQKHRSGRYRKMEDVKTKLFTRPSPRAVKVGER